MDDGGESIRPVTAFEAGKELTSDYFREKDGENMSAWIEGSKIPAFGNEEQEALWWDEHKAQVKQKPGEASRSGGAKRGTAQELSKGARASKRTSRSVCHWRRLRAEQSVPWSGKRVQARVSQGRRNSRAVPVCRLAIRVM